MEVGKIKFTALYRKELAAVHTLGLATTALVLAWDAVMLTRVGWWETAMPSALSLLPVVFLPLAVFTVACRSTALALRKKAEQSKAVIPASSTSWLGAKTLALITVQIGVGILGLAGTAVVMARELPALHDLGGSFLQVLALDCMWFLAGSVAVITTLVSSAFLAVTVARSVPRLHSLAGSATWLITVYLTSVVVPRLGKALGFLPNVPAFGIKIGPSGVSFIAVPLPTEYGVAVLLVGLALFCTANLLLKKVR